jgi:hypothetical protein
MHSLPEAAKSRRQPDVTGAEDRGLGAGRGTHLDPISRKRHPSRRPAAPGNHIAGAGRESAHEIGPSEHVLRGHVLSSPCGRLRPFAEWRRVKQKWSFMIVSSRPPTAAPDSRGWSAGLVFLASRPDMRDILLPRRFLAAFGVVIALVGTQMLGGLFSGLRPLNHHRFKRRSQQLHVVAIGPSYHDGNRNPLGIGQHAAFGPLLATVRGIGARGFPPKGALVMAPSTLCQVHSSPLRSS